MDQFLLFPPYEYSIIYPKKYNYALFIDLDPATFTFHHAAMKHTAGITLFLVFVTVARTRGMTWVMPEFAPAAFPMSGRLGIGMVD